MISLSAMGRQAEQDSRQLRPSHVAALDGVRGLAVTLVLLFHLLWSNSETGSRVMNGLVALRGAGWVGVDLFFALSGFLITGILFDSSRSSDYFRNFYARRVLRIWPLYYGVVGLLYLFVTFGLHEDAGRAFGLLLTYLNSTPLWWHMTSGSTLMELTNHLWSLAAEEQFYLVWPVVVFAVRDRRRLMWAAVVVGAMAPAARLGMMAHGASVDAVYKMTMCRADSLLAGAWVALAVRGPARERVLRWAPLVFAMGLAGCVAIGVRAGNFDYELNAAARGWGFSLVALTSAAWVTLSLRGGWTSRLMTAGWLQFMGKYSFGIYVLHVPVGVLVASVLMPALRTQVHGKAVLHVLQLGLAAGITIPLAMGSFVFLEMPFLRLKRYFREGRRVTAREEVYGAESQPDMVARARG